MRFAYEIAGPENRKIGDDLVRLFHYSGRPAAAVKLCAVALLGGFPVAACFLSIPPTRWSIPVLELSRLVLHPDFRGVEPLTRSISFAVNSVRRDSSLPRLIVSFADSTQSHHGGIYQAASWAFGGTRVPDCDGFFIDGKFRPRRSAYHHFKTSSVPAVRAICESLGSSFEAHYDTGKHIYWRAVDRAGKRDAASLNLATPPYPKPERL